MVNNNFPQRYNGNSYPSIPKEWEKLAIEMMAKGAFLFGGGLAVYLIIKLLLGK